MTTSDYLKAGYADAQADTPWLRAPISFEAWKTGAAETTESSAYWKGFNGFLEDAFAKASR